MHPAQPSKARLGRVHFIFPHIQICNRVLQGGQFKVTLFTAHKSSNGSHFLNARVLVSVNLGMDGQCKWLLCNQSILHI